MGRSSVALVLAAATLAGCGGEDRRAETTTRTVAAPAQRCSATHARAFRVCAHALGGPPRTRASIQRRDASGWRTIAAGPAGTVHDGLQVGHWRNAWLSPDGKTLLAQWSAECEIPIAFFVEATTGAMQPVTGERNWADAPESIALGWAADGRARVRLPKGACGSSAAKPGVYLIDPATNELTRAGG